jgi:hypothetical protein
MALKLTSNAAGKVLHVTVSGKLEASDYERFAPEVEHFIEQHDKIRILFETRDFEGWSAGALWEDIKFDVKHFNNIERLAIVGEKKWEKGMATFCKPFTSAEVRFFDSERLDEARLWVEENLPGQA